MKIGDLLRKFYIERLVELEDKHESELSSVDRELIREYAIELEILGS